MYSRQDDTIVAPSTAPGKGAIGIVRISGPQTLEIVSRVFEGKNLNKLKGNTIHFGKIKDEKGELVDECLISLFRAPKSYTKEDLIEISCHGSPYIINCLIQLLTRCGARIAEPGEFTLRAFVNGLYDLLQAEAVADLIVSETKENHRISINQLRGGISNEISELRQELIDFAALIELELDFSEEDVEFADRANLLNLFETALNKIGGLLNSFELGNAIKNGVPTVIAGRPNSGKSTLLNTLLNEERAIVSDIPGTTRDSIEENLNIQGLQFRLIDTAGIRISEDLIEQKGVQRTMDNIRKASLLIYLFDLTQISPQDLWRDIDEYLLTNQDRNSSVRYLFVANKIDLATEDSLDRYFKTGLVTKENLIGISAKKNIHINNLKDHMYSSIITRPSDLDQNILTNARHVEAFSKAKESLQKAKESLLNGLSGDLMALDIRQALFYLGLITGEVSSDELLDSIFTRFCIGK